ncbi:hypothetical protein V6Z11_A03G089600 [Gossypium hirsutum]
MSLGVEIAEIGWDLSLRAQSQRALAMKSVWLREEGEGDWGRNRVGCQRSGSTLEAAGNSTENRKNIDPVLGFNLEGSLSKSYQVGDSSNPIYLPIAMDHDLEDNMLIGEEGHKRAREEAEDLSRSDEVNSTVIRSKELLEVNFVSAAAKRQTSRK